MKLFEEINFSSSHVFIIDMQRPCLEREYKGLNPEIYIQVKKEAIKNISMIMNRSKANVLVETVYFDDEETISEITDVNKNICLSVLRKMGVPLLPKERNRRDQKVEELYIKAKKHIETVLEEGNMIDIVGAYTGRCVLDFALSITREFPEYESQVRIIPDATIPATIEVDGTSQDAHNIKEYIPSMYKRRKRLLDYYGISLNTFCVPSQLNK